MSTVQSEYAQILENIIENEKSVRFVAVCNRYGEITYKILRKGVIPHLNEYETSKLLREATSSWHYRHQLSYKLGKGKFALAVYEKLIRLTVPLDNENLMLLTLDSFEKVPQIVEQIKRLKEQPRI